MKTYNRREVERIILKNGWELDHCTGGHSIYKKEGVKRTLSIAYKKCNRMVVQRLIKEFGLVTQEGAMGKYLVTVREIFEHTYLVEADSSGEAERICNAESNGCDVDDYVDTEYDSELVEDEEDLESIDYDELQKEL